MRRARVRAVLAAGVAAGITSTVAQVALWIAFTDAWPGILFRDARLAAALVMGPGVLQRADDEARMMAVAAVVHFALSIGFAALLAPFAAGRSRAGAVAVGAVFGATLYAVNLHVLTAPFPWFTAARGLITLAAHVVFGVTAALVYRPLEAKDAASR